MVEDCLGRQNGPKCERIDKKRVAIAHLPHNVAQGFHLRLRIFEILTWVLEDLQDVIGDLFGASVEDEVADKGGDKLVYLAFGRLRRCR